MSVFYLIRHGENDLVGHRIAGRRPGVHLNESGRRQAEVVGQYLAQHPVHQLFSSPLERARETAEPAGRSLGLAIQISEALNELNFGDWTGQSFSDLEQDVRWKQWNVFRSAGRIPNGEAMFEAQARMVGKMEQLRREFPDQHLALFGHGDPLRAAVAYYLGMPLDQLLRLEISPGSLTILAVNDWNARLCTFNLELSDKGEAFPARALGRS